MIKDSGDRTEFETGAKRDMHAGKGRMDLLPWYGIMEVSKHCEEGALKYGEHNVDKGIPLHSLLDSASRHLAKYMVGMDDEDHLRSMLEAALRHSGFEVRPVASGRAALDADRFRRRRAHHHLGRSLPPA